MKYANRRYCATCKKYKCRCASCVADGSALIKSDGEWYCNELDNYCSEIACCTNWEEIETDCKHWESYDGHRALTVNVGFVNSDGEDDETQFDIDNLDDLAELFSDFCEENGFGLPELLYIYSV